MKLEWVTRNRQKGDFVELPLDKFFFLASDESGQIRYGQLSLNLSPDSIEKQVQGLLSEIKATGVNKSSVRLTVVADEKLKEARKLIAEFERFGISLKTKYVPAGQRTRLRLNPLTAEVWISRAPEVATSAVPLALGKDQPKTRVLIVEDSLPVQRILQKVYSEIPQVEIIATVGSIAKAAELFFSTKPDFVSLDMKLEDGTGLDFLKKVEFLSYAQKNKVRCALVTDSSANDGPMVFDAMALGVSTYIQKPQVSDLDDFARELAELLSELFRIEEKRVAAKKEGMQRPEDLSKYKLVAIGSSTGGTEVVRDLIGGFPLESPPLVVVQHMPSSFTGLFADRIQKQTGRPTIEVKELTRLMAGHAYIASGNVHLVVEVRDRELFVKPKNGDFVNRFKPSVSVLFNSIYESGVAPKTVAIMLTGMGHDGAKEMLKLKDCGALTIGQSKESCVVYGMPRAAAELGALCWSASPQQMVNLFNERKKVG